MFFENLLHKKGLKGGISIDADSGPPRYILWCCGCICHQPHTFFKIGSDHTVLESSNHEFESSKNIIPNYPPWGDMIETQIASGSFFYFKFQSYLSKSGVLMHWYVKGWLHIFSRLLIGGCLITGKWLTTTFDSNILIACKSAFKKYR